MTGSFAYIGGKLFHTVIVCKKKW